MKKSLAVVLLMGAIVMLGYSPSAEANALLSISTGAFSAVCNTSLAFSATNCGAGFSAVAGGGAITFTGPVTGYSFSFISVVSNSPGSPVAGNVLDTKFALSHTSGTDDLVVLFGTDNFTLPAGPGLFLSASDSGTFGESAAGDFVDFRSWGRPDNVLAIGGTVVDAPTCIPGAGLTTSCSTATSDVVFARGAGPYALLGRQTIHLAVGELAATLNGTVAANAAPIQTPEGPSVLLLGLGTGMLLVGVRRFRP